MEFYDLTENPKFKTTSRNTFPDKKGMYDKVYVDNLLFVASGWYKVTDQSLEDEKSIHICPCSGDSIIRHLGMWVYSDEVMSEKEYREFMIDDLLEE